MATATRYSAAPSRAYRAANASSRPAARPASSGSAIPVAPAHQTRAGTRLDLSKKRKSRPAHADEAAVVLPRQRPQERPHLGALEEEPDRVDPHLLARLAPVPRLGQHQPHVPAEFLLPLVLPQCPLLLGGEPRAARRQA